MLTLDYGRPPWIALMLALTFGSYGLCKKQANAPAVESLTFETIVIAPVALAYLGLADVARRVRLHRTTVPATSCC